MRSSVARWGNSLAVRLPKGIADSAEIGEGTEIELECKDGEIVLRRAKPKYAIKDLMARFKPEHRHEETDWGPPVGQEIW